MTIVPGRGPATAAPAGRVTTGLAEDIAQNHIAEVCAWRNVAHYHTHRSDYSEPGFPDSVCIGAGGGLVFEAKNDTGKTTPEQDLWLWLFESLGFRVLVVRPADTLPRADLGGRSLIQHEIEKIATGEGGRKFPPHIVAALKKSRNAQLRKLATEIARGKARRRT